MARPVVLQVLGPSTGGIRGHVTELAARLEQRGWRVEVAGPVGVLDGLRVLDHQVAVPSAPDLLAAVAARRTLAAAVAAAKADVIHAHGLKAGWLAASLGRRCRPPLVVTAHNVVLPEVAGSGVVTTALAHMEAVLPARADAMVAVSAEMARRLAGVRGAGRVTVVAPVAPAPRPTRGRADVRAAWGLRPGQPLVVSVGRLHPQKGHATLIDAAAILARWRPGVRVVIVGGGPSAGALASRIERLDLSGVVSLVGPAVSGADALAAADVVALASIWEGWPLVVSEAVQLGRPVVATAVGGIPEMLADGVSGWLVAPRAPAEMAGALEAALADPGEAAARASVARLELEARCSPDALVDGVEAVYLDVLTRR